MPAALSPFPSSLRDATLATWFDARVRPMIDEYAEACSEGSWEAFDDALADDAVDGYVHRMCRVEGAPVVAAWTNLVGAVAGHGARLIALGLLRDGVLLRISEPGSLKLLRHLDGWYGDARLNDSARAVVAAGRPWAGRPGVRVVPDPEALAQAAMEEITRLASPVVEIAARRSRRGRAGLWAQVADGVGYAAHALRQADPACEPEAIMAATQALLAMPGAPWKHVPRFWLADSAASGPVLIQHRGSCCLYYRFDLDGREAEAGGAYEAEPDPRYRAYLERFGDAPPRYCDTCLFREADDVQARVIFDADYEHASQPSTT